MSGSGSVYRVGGRLVEFCGRRTVVVSGKGARQLTRSAHRCKIYGSAFIAQKAARKNLNGAAHAHEEAWHAKTRHDARVERDSESRCGC